MFTITPCHLQWHRLTLPHQNTHHITTIQCQNSQMGQQLMFTQLTPELWVSPPSSYNLFLPASPCLRPALITACHPLTSHHGNSAIQLAHTWGNNRKQIRSSFPIYQLPRDGGRAIGTCQVYCNVVAVSLVSGPE